MSNADKYYQIKDKQCPLTIYQESDAIDVQYITTENIKNFFTNKITLVYGPAESMKTTTVRNIMFLLKDKFPYVLVYAPNNDINDDYTDIIPAPLIHKNMSIDLLRRIYDTQLNRTEHRHEIEKHMKLIFESVKSNDDTTKIKSFSDDKHKILSYMRKVILRKKAFIDAQYNDIITNMSFNPKLLFILDDVSSSLPKLLRSKDPIIEKMFFESRHVNITLICIIHNVSQLIPAFRDSAHINIFCKKSVAYRWFENNTDRSTVKLAKKIIDVVFDEDNNKKLIYDKNRDKYFFITPIYFKEFNMCSPFIYDALKNISKN